MNFCDDIDLMVWEPGLFLEAAFAHQALFKNVAGTLTGTTLTLSSGVLGPAAPGMVASVITADGSLTQLLEVVSVSDTTHAVLSALRSRQADPPITPLAGGAVKVSIVSFRPQIAAVGDELLGLVGMASDRTTVVSRADADLFGFRSAAIFCTLAALYRTLAALVDGKSVVSAKQAFYQALALAARRAIAATLDSDGDGTPDTVLQPAAPVLERQ